MVPLVIIPIAIPIIQLPREGKPVPISVIWHCETNIWATIGKKRLKIYSRERDASHPTTTFKTPMKMKFEVTQCSSRNCLQCRACQDLTVLGAGSAATNCWKMQGCHKPQGPVISFYVCTSLTDHMCTYTYHPKDKFDWLSNEGSWRIKIQGHQKFRDLLISQVLVNTYERKFLKRLKHFTSLNQYLTKLKWRKKKLHEAVHKDLIERAWTLLCI